MKTKIPPRLEMIDLQKRKRVCAIWQEGGI
jgi:hypothetical protein